MICPPRRQAGFTIVETAAVLVIAGLIFGSVMKNRELVASARAKSLASEIGRVATAIHTYRGLYHSLPGDDPAVASRFSGARTASSVAGNLGNGRIDGAWDSLVPTDESYLAWQHLRLAQLLSGTTEVGASPAASDGYTPRSPIDGREGITSNPVMSGVVWPASLFWCASGVDGRLVRRMDTMMDDGDTLTGDLRAICAGECSTGPGVRLTPDNEAGNYTVCAAI